MNKLFLSGLLGLIFLLAKPLSAQTSEQEALSGKTRILFLLDASGSMLAQWEGRQTRMDIAKRLLSETIDSLKVNPRLELALRAYGHLYPSRYQNCSDSKLEVPFSSENHEQIKQKLHHLTPQGTTPIAYSLEKAAEDFPVDVNARNIIIMITDGLESCGGDPCAVSRKLQEKQVILQPFVIALGAEEGFEQQFDCMGDYYDASSISQFREALRKTLTQSLGKTTLTVELLNEAGQPREKDITVTLQHHYTQQAIRNFVHYRDSRGITDTIEVDPVLPYDVVLHTIPPMEKKAVRLKGGQHNTLMVEVPRGQLTLSQKNHHEYPGGVKAIVRRHQQPQTLYTQPVGSSQKYLAGQYDVEVLTLPRTYFYGLELGAGKEINLDLPAPGIANIRADFSGIGDLFVLEEGNGQKLIHQLDEKKSVNSLALQPGQYRLVFRARQAQGSRYTKIRDFEIKSGATTNINLFGR
ncbi:vWA domain-containing protein [Nafulsella turpanensis]|uniref:vWA domain-containing protein n=1 Tax=Nafulsella turpanensis TaxID=1265690 RepID=UPI0003458727|nr:VWA domain-containing protein [Nafulsella turpanensis]